MCEMQIFFRLGFYMKDTTFDNLKWENKVEK